MTLLIILISHLRKIVYNENESILIRANNTAVSENVYANSEKDDVYYFVNSIDNGWITERRKNKKRFKDVCNSIPCELDSLNRFNALTDEETHPDEINYKNRKERADKNKRNLNGTVKSKMYVNRFPERDIIPRKIT